MCVELEVVNEHSLRQLFKSDKTLVFTRTYLTEFRVVEILSAFLCYFVSKTRKINSEDVYSEKKINK